METGIVQSINTECLISIIVPVYNGEKYLKSCLDSILAQTLTGIEIIIVDDGSTDTSGIIANHYCEVYEDKIFVLHQKNSGVSSARFNGIRAAHGEWIGFVDADDEIDADMYERLLKNAIEHQAQISHCGYQTIVNNGERIHYFYNTGEKIVQNRKDGIRDLLQGRFIEPSLCNKLFLRTLFDGIHKEKQAIMSLRYNEDLLLNYVLFKRAERSVFEDFCPYHYMARPQSATRKPFDSAKYTDPVKVWEQILQESQEDLKTTAISKYLLACFFAYSSLMEAGYNKQICDKYKNELLKYKSKWRYLRKPDRLRLNLIMRSPALYKLAQGFYVRVLQKKRYE